LYLKRTEDNEKTSYFSVFWSWFENNKKFWMINWLQAVQKQKCVKVNKQAFIHHSIRKMYQLN